MSSNSETFTVVPDFVGSSAPASVSAIITPAATATATTGYKDTTKNVTQTAITTTSVESTTQSQSQDAVEQMMSQLRNYCDQNNLPCLLSGINNGNDNDANTEATETTVQQHPIIQCCRQMRILAHHLLAHKKPTSHSYAMAWQRSLVHSLQPKNNVEDVDDEEEEEEEDNDDPPLPELQKEVSAALAALAAVQSQPQQRSPTNTNNYTTKAMSPPRMTWLSQQQPLPPSLSPTKPANGIMLPDHARSDSAGPNKETMAAQQKDGGATAKRQSSIATQPATTTMTTKPTLPLNKPVAVPRPVVNNSLSRAVILKEMEQFPREKYGSVRRAEKLGKRIFVNPPRTEQLDTTIYQTIMDGTPHKEDVKEPESGRRAVQQVCANDVILGRGNSVQSFPGNEKFRMYVHQTKPEYLCASRNRKGSIAVDLVYRVLTQTPPGRFIESIDNEFYVVDYERAVEKTCQALREKKAQPPPNYKKWEKAQKKTKRQAVVNLKQDVKRRQLILLDQQPQPSSPTTSTTITTHTTDTIASSQQEEMDQVKVPAVTMPSTSEPKPVQAQAQRSRGQQLIKRRRALPMMLSSNVVGSNKTADAEGMYYDYSVPNGQQTQKCSHGDTRKRAATSATATELPELVAATVPQQLPLALSMSSPSASFFLQLRLEELRNKPLPACGAAGDDESFKPSSSSDVTARETDVACILAKMSSIQHC